MEVVDIFVEILFGTVGAFDLESIQGFGVNDALNLVVVVDNREIGEAGFVEFIKNERAEDFAMVYKNHFGFCDHEI